MSEWNKITLVYGRKPLGKYLLEIKYYHVISWRKNSKLLGLAAVEGRLRVEQGQGSAPKKLRNTH
jgi:hypothetical protein